MTELDLVSKLSYLAFDNIKRNNRLAYLINFLSVMILLFCGGLYTVKHWFTVEKIVITGNIEHVTPVQLSYIAHNKLHGTFFTLDIAELKDEFQALPWVRKVSLQRHFPHTIVVTLEEYNVIARIGDDALLDDANTQRFCNLVQELSSKTQFVYISHNRLAMEMADQLIGVTMQEKGVSTVVSVSLGEAVQHAQVAPE